ncbi:PAS-domain containing protein [Roseovarius sp. SYSU LYC5161]|uniref:PAS-domain containing protein n=1 Tax=Roseovarius halophilus (ex Wu et al. 2025) TaxID=3376060 RepID=UPI00399973C6
MPEINLSLWAWPLVFAACGIVAFLVLYALGRTASRDVTRPGAATGAHAPAHFLLEQDKLVDTDAAAFSSITENGVQPEWPALRDWLAPRFADLPATLPDAGPGETTYHATDPDDGATLSIRPQARSTRVTLSDPSPTDASCAQDAYGLRHDKALLSGLSRQVPHPVWVTDAAGDVMWRNDACTALTGHGDPLFKAMSGLDATDTSAKHRVTVSADDIGAPDQHWFDVETRRHDDYLLHFATDVTGLVHAETVQREFVQTLTKTFATLTTGLVVFDRNRRLALFNPALIDHTGLPAEFLSARPGLISFFDQLRDRQVMPEPKNYATWRARINDMVQSAAGGAYRETWSLPDGTTFRVSGRPHPDGAVAFLFEDISAEISLTRRFRAQLEMRENVMDLLDSPIAVIGSDNILLFCNRACRQLLGVDPETSFADMHAEDLFATCQVKLPDTHFWDDARRWLSTRAGRETLQGEVPLPDGDTVSCQLAGLNGGAAMLMIRGRQPLHQLIRHATPA